MKQLTFRLIAALAMITGVQSALAQDLGCSSLVSLNGGTIEVESVESEGSSDDTENVQCALDAATEGGYRDVFLTSPQYTIGAIAVTGKSSTRSSDAM